VSRKVARDNGIEYAPPLGAVRATIPAAWIAPISIGGRSLRVDLLFSVRHAAESGAWL